MCTHVPSKYSLCQELEVIHYSLLEWMINIGLPITIEYISALPCTRDEPEDITLVKDKANSPASDSPAERKLKGGCQLVN